MANPRTSDDQSEGEDALSRTRLTQHFRFTPVRACMTGTLRPTKGGIRGTSNEGIQRRQNVMVKAN
jgi:hypothetical protein